MEPSIEERFFARIEPGPTADLLPELGACWIWQGPPTADGYGQIWLEGRAVRAHVAGWGIARGIAAPAGVRFEHFACTRRLCVNPEHVRPQGRFLSDWCEVHDFCPRGHRLNRASRITVAGQVVCRTCRAEDERQARRVRRQGARGLIL